LRPSFFLRANYVSTGPDLGGFNAVAEAISPIINVRIPTEGGHRFRSKPAHTLSCVDRGNRIAIVALLILALSASSALFMLLELSKPFDGLLALPERLVRKALPPLPRT